MTMTRSGPHRNYPNGVQCPPTSSSCQTLFVNKGGSDATGDGSRDAPYLTIQAAMTSITDASTAKRYTVLVSAGEYVDPFLIKPWVSVVGRGGSSGFYGVVEITAPADSCGFDASWGTSGFSVAWYSNLVFANHQTWDENAVGATQAQLTFFNVDFNGGAKYNGPATSGVDNVTWVDCLSFGGVLVKGWQFLWTINSFFLGGTCEIDAGPAGALSNTTWLAQNTCVGAVFNPTNVVIKWAAPSPATALAKGDFANSSIVGALTLDGAHTSFVSHVGGASGATSLLNGAPASGGTVLGGHATTSGGAPSAAIQAAAGTGASASIAGNDNAGQVTINTGTGPVAGALVVITFATPFAAPPTVLLGRADITLGGAFSVSAVTALGFTIACVGVPTLSSTYKFPYIALG